MTDPLTSGPDAPPPLQPPVPESGGATRWRWWLHLLLIAAYPLVLGLVGWSRAASYGPALGHGVPGLLLVCVVNLGMFAVAFGLAWLASRASTDALLLRWRGGFWTVPIGIGYSVALRLGLGILAVVAATALVLAGVTTPQALQQYFTANRPDVETLVDISALRHNPLYFWLSLTLVSFVLAGLREELWRSAFLAGVQQVGPRRWGQRTGQFVGVVLGSIIFGVGHLPQGPLAVGLTGFLGLGLGTIMVLHKSIWPAVIAHGMFDATTMALLPLVIDLLPKVHA